MAVKGKSRRRQARSPGAPAHKPVVRAAPVAQRAAVRQAIVVALTIATILGGLRVAQNVARADALRSYLRELRAAQAGVVPFLSPGVPVSIGEAAKAFIEGKAPAKEFLELAGKWEEGFRSAKTAVAGLGPPSGLSDVQDILVEGLELYVGVARLYNLAGQNRLVAAAAAPPARQAFENKVQVTLQHAGEAADRAADVYTLGGRRLLQVRERWLGIPAPKAVPGVPDGLLPDPAPSASPSS